MHNNYRDKVWLVILWAIFAVILIFLCLHSNYRWFSHDEFEHIHTAWKILQGQEIYVDFFQHHHPFLSYLLVPVVSILGDTTTSIFASRYLILLMVFGILLITYFLALKLFKEVEIAIISLILTATAVAFYDEAIKVRPDVPLTLTGLLSIYCLFIYYDKKSIVSLVASAIFLALSFLFLQKAIPLIIVIGFIFLFDLYTKRMHFKEVLLFALVFLLTLFPYYIYLLANGFFEKYFMMNWILNLKIRESHGLSRYTILMDMFRANTVTFMFYAIGFILVVKSHKNMKFAVLSACLFTTVLLIYKNLWEQYFLFIIPLIGIIASCGIVSTLKHNVNKLVVIIFAVYLPLSTMHDFVRIVRNRDFDNTKQMEQLQKINYVLSITDKKDKVYDGDIIFNLFRDDIDYFWFCSGPGDCIDQYNEITDYKYDVYDLILKYKPKIISSYNINLEDERIKNYKISEKYDDLLIRTE